MEDTAGDQRTKNDSIISAGSEDGGPSFCTITHIFSVNNSGAKTLIEYDIDKCLDMKKETVQDEVYQWGQQNFLLEKNHLDEKCIATKMSSDNNSGTKTSIEYDIDESLDIKEETIQDQQTKSESSESTETQDGGPYSCSTTHISASNTYSGKTLIKYDIDESLDIKEEIVQDQERRQRGKHDFLSGKNQLDENCITTEIPSENTTGAKTLNEYDYHKTSKIKEEILQDEVHQRENHNVFSERNELHGKCITTEMSSDNNSGSKTLIEYKYDETLKIKEEIIEDQENIEEGLNKKYESKLCTLDTKRETDIMTVRNPRTSKKKKNLQESKSEPKNIYSCDKCARSYSSLGSLYKHRRVEHAAIKVQFICDICDFKTKQKYYLSKHIMSRHFKKNQVSKPEKKYKCEKCARSYTRKDLLKRHQKFECGVMPQFVCNFCSKKFKQKSTMNRHILHVHQKTDSKVSLARHNCDKCSRSYIWQRDLTQHKRAEHAVIKPQFTCDFCGFITKRKHYLLNHITSRHFQEFEVSIQQPEKKYKCDKCARSYGRLPSLYKHKKFDCGVIPQFSCEFCGTRFRRKIHVNRHVLHVHQKTDSRPSLGRLNCDRCSRSYIWLRDLIQHQRAEHAVIKPQFTCQFCGFITKRKHYLLNHTNSRHFQETKASMQ